MIRKQRLHLTGKGIFFIVLFFNTYSCSTYTGRNVTVTPRTFKIQMKLEENKNGFLVKTLWGENKTPHFLNWDNHSPTWGSNKIIRGNPSVTKSNEFKYRTSTADGTYIHGDVFKCAKIALGNVNFNDFLFYYIPEQKNQENSEKVDGVFGEDLISTGIWEFDFKNKTITFASTIDSIGSLSQANLIPTTFENNTIQIKMKFGNDIMLPVEIDFGYNGDVLLPENEFATIAEGIRNIDNDSVRFSTPANSQIINRKLIFDSITIGNFSYLTSISTNPLISDALIGRTFFREHEFVIFDYVNKSVYISKKRMVR